MLDANAMSTAYQRMPAIPAEPPQLQSLAHLRRFRREQDIYAQEERSDTWYRVASGSARKYYMRADGRRQLVDIYLPGDFFGFTTRVHHKFAVQAIADGTLVACYPRQRVEALADKDPATAHEIRIHCSEAVRRLQDQMLIIGTMTAQEKVREFLVLRISARSASSAPEGYSLLHAEYRDGNYDRSFRVSELAALEAVNASKLGNTSG